MGCLTKNIIAVKCESADCDHFRDCLDDRFGTRSPVLGDRDLLLIIEDKRGFIHIRKNSEGSIVCPTVSPEDWDSIYLGPECCASLIDANIRELYVNGSYLMLFDSLSMGEVLVCRSFPVVRTPLEFSLLDSLMNSIDDFRSGNELHRESLTNHLTKVSENVVLHIERTIPEVSMEAQQRLSELIAHSSFVLGPLVPILLDEMTEEVYLDSPESEVYFDHQVLGRCHTSLRVKSEDVPRIVTLLRAQSNMHLDSSNPSLKTGLDLLGSSLRVSATVPPLSPDGLNLEIRRARTEPFSLSGLIENGTLSTGAAAVLVFAIANRFNITITGEPGSGKTTLLNALDMVVPKKWRKLYVEDVVESRKMPDSRQVRFKVDPVEEGLYRSNKSEEIVKCLHRSPDYVILGEIQTEEHTLALFRAMAAGLRVMQTCHSSSASALVSRWNLSHGIKYVSIGLMDLIVTLRRAKPAESKRIVGEIVEVCRELKDGMVSFSGLNLVYSDTQGLLGNWAENGPFFQTAREAGEETHVAALENLVRVLEDSRHESDFSMIYNLWNNGLPVQYEPHEKI